MFSPRSEKVVTKYVFFCSNATSIRAKYGRFYPITLPKPEKKVMGFSIIASSVGATKHGFNPYRATLVGAKRYVLSFHTTPPRSAQS